MATITMRLPIGGDSFNCSAATELPLLRIQVTRYLHPAWQRISFVHGNGARDDGKRPFKCIVESAPNYEEPFAGKIEMKLPGAKRDEAFGVGMKGSGSTRGRLCQAGSKRVGGLFPGYPVSGKETDAESGGYRHDPREADRLLESILVAAKVGTNADGATLYRVTEDGRALRFEIVRNDSLHLAMGGIGRESASLPDVPLMDKHGEPNDSMVAAYAAVHRRTVRVADAYTAAGFDFSGTRSFDQRTGYRSQSILAVPITGIDGETAGVLQLINALDPMTGKVKPFSAEDQRVAESFAAQAGLVVKNKSPPAQAMQRGSR